MNKLNNLKGRLSQLIYDINDVFTCFAFEPSRCTKESLEGNYPYTFIYPDGDFKGGVVYLSSSLFHC